MNSENTHRVVERVGVADHRAVGQRRDRRLEVQHLRSGTASTAIPAGAEPRSAARAPSASVRPLTPTYTVSPTAITSPPSSVTGASIAVSLEAEARERRGHRLHLGAPLVGVGTCEHGKSLCQRRHARVLDGGDGAPCRRPTPATSVGSLSSRVATRAAQIVVGARGLTRPCPTSAWTWATRRRCDAAHDAAVRHGARGGLPGHRRPGERFSARPHGAVVSVRPTRDRARPRSSRRRSSA